MTSKQLNADIDAELAEVLGDVNPTIGDEELIGMVIAWLIAAYRNAIDRG